MTHTLHLRAAGASLLLDLSAAALPVVAHYGADLGDVPEPALDALAADLVPGIPSSSLDEPWPFTVLPTQAEGWLGTPGLAGHRSGTAAFPRWSRVGEVSVHQQPDGAHEVAVTCVCDESALGLRSVLRLEATGLLRLRHEVTNHGDDPYTLDGVVSMLPVPGELGELLDLTGRHNRERAPQRSAFDQGTHLRASRRGRTGHDATLLLVAGTPGFGFGHGEVLGVHVGFSGNHVHLAERLPEGAGHVGQGCLGGGELLLPGEVVLAPGASHTTPWVYFTWSDAGLDGASARIHRWLRARPGHPRGPRPVTLNIWEAVYFDHDLARLTQLADVAAQVGVERFVVDDGWFGSRRDDTTGLGDWQVSPQVWPDGLEPLAEHVHGLGLQFGLWFEPEMANPDSDLARDHPDWLLVRPPTGDPARDAARWPRLSRTQVLVDLAHPEAYAYLLDAVSGLVSRLGIDYIKWDQNRNLHEAVRASGGTLAPAVHEQTLAFYRLLDELRARHPRLEIESCASGGARVDLGVLERTDRIWGSDTNDPLERQQIQRYTTLLVPPELIGSHVGPPRSHTTHRHASLSFRFATALFGHAGLEWDISTCTPEERDAVARFTALYRELRPLLHGGDVVRADQAPEGMQLHGVVAADRSEAVFALVRTATATPQLPGRLRLPGLDPAREYQVRVRHEIAEDDAYGATPPAWYARGGVRATGAVLGALGFAAPQLHPEQALVLQVTALG